MFPDNHTAVASDLRRAFLMGNALVKGIVEKVGQPPLDEAPNSRQADGRFNFFVLSNSTLHPPNLSC